MKALLQGREVWMDRSVTNRTRIQQIQIEAHQWREEMFDPATVTSMHQFVGVAEELGELAHALLKRDQGIRGSTKEHRAAIEDAVGDLVLFLMGVCSCENMDFEYAVARTWASVKHRNWVANPVDGMVNERTAGSAGE